MLPGIEVVRNKFLSLLTIPLFRVNDSVPSHGLLNPYPGRHYWISTQSRVIESLPVEGYWVPPSLSLLNPTCLSVIETPPCQGLLNPTMQRLLNTTIRGLFNPRPVRCYWIPTQSRVIGSLHSQGLFKLNPCPWESRGLRVIEFLPVKGYWIPTH